MVMPAVWTSNQENRLIELVNIGLSCGDIANVSDREFGRSFSRNAVGGKIARLRQNLGLDTLRAGFAVGRKYVPPGMGNPESPNESILRLLEWKRKHGIKERPKSNHGVMSAIAASERRNHRKVEARQMMRGAIVCCESPKLIWDLVWCDCRWIITEDTPINDTFYCANVIEPNSSYCAAHARMAHDGRLPGQGFVKRPGIAPNWMTIRSGRRAA